MKKLAAFCLLLLIALPAGAIDDGQVKYSGGTIPSLQAGAIGRLDTTSVTDLSFEYDGKKLAIPYSKIDSFEFTDPVARHLGILPAIAVGLSRKRQRRHLVQIVYRDGSDSKQVVIFEVSKHATETLLAVLRVRAPQAYRPLYPIPTRFSQKNWR